MTYNELYKNLEKYTHGISFNLLGLSINKYDYYNTPIYSFIHQDVSYAIIEEVQRELKDDILIELNNELKKLIRKRKISDILNENFNI